MRKTIIGTGIVVVVFALGSFALHQFNDPVNAGEYDAFAQCLTDKGAMMYGAWWCPHCQNQKKLFGDAFKKVKYIECANPINQNEQTAECETTKITGYPTWIFADGSRTEGEASLNALSLKTGCTLPSYDKK